MKQLLMAALTLLACGLASAHEDTLSAADLTAIKAALERFREGWVRDDADYVMQQFTTDAVIMPHHGVKPRLGAAAIRAFWWPKNSPPASVERFEQRHEEIGGHHDLAYVRGDSIVEYVWGEPGKLRRYRNAGTTLTLLRRSSAGTWKISHRMWDDPPTEDLGPVIPETKPRAQ